MKVLRSSWGGMRRGLAACEGDCSFGEGLLLLLLAVSGGSCCVADVEEVLGRLDGTNDAVAVVVVGKTFWRGRYVES